MSDQELANRRVHVGASRTGLHLIELDQPAACIRHAHVDEDILDDAVSTRYPLVLAPVPQCIDDIAVTGK